MNINEIRIKTNAGTIILYGDYETQTAGISFIPNDAHEEIDIAYVKCTDNNNKDAYENKHGELKNLHVYCYEDVWNEDYTHDFIISGEEAYESLTKPYQPESQKM